MKAVVGDVRIERLPVIRDERGSLTVVDFANCVPFTVSRLFYISGAPAGTSRGGHAHYRCRQFMICQAGRLQLELADGTHTRSLELLAGQAVLIEPGIYAAQVYLDDESGLLVLCDRPYEAGDYIHGMDAFLKYRREAN